MTTAVSPAESTLAPRRPRTEAPAPLRAVHTPNFPALLRQLGASLLVTTYQAGKLVMVRDEGDHLNTHGSIDLSTGKYVPIAEVPGFTRGLDFAGNLAFIGLSQVRESAVFSGIPITERLSDGERTCGVCVIDLTTGLVVALLRFETAVQEVFAVTVLPGKRYPDLINDDEKLLENSFTVPDAALADVPAALRAASVNGHAQTSMKS